MISFLSENGAGPEKFIKSRVTVWESPEAFRYIRKRYGNGKNVTCVHGAVGSRSGKAFLYKDPGNPTLSTVSVSWINRMKTKPSFRNVSWREKEEVPMMTLDTLIAHWEIRHSRIL